MKFKYLMRGIGLGVIITAVVMGAYSRSAVADARVSVLKEYGLDEDKPILPEAQTTEDIEPTSEPVIVKQNPQKKLAQMQHRILISQKISQHLIFREMQRMKMKKNLQQQM